MKELSLREVQLGELEILKRLDSICREQGLKYFLYAGTMIGAVRHKAFIPWDDDIDVAMPRRDYDRLMAWWDEHGAQEAPLRMMNIHTNPKYIYPISRLCDTRYQVDYEGTREYGLGLFVDIYPFDGCGSTQEEAEQILQSAGTGREDDVSRLNGALCSESARRTAHAREARGLSLGAPARQPALHPQTRGALPPA